jgi:hypothetical protein
LNKKNQSRKFEEILLESIDDAFFSLGESVKKSLYYHLEKNFLIPRQDIPLRIEDFLCALERIFASGARQLELLIMEKLYLKTRCSFKWEGPKWIVPDLTFKQYLELIRVSCANEEKFGNLEVIVDAGERQEQRK